MDAFGLVPNIIATIETVYKVIKFLEEIKNSGLECNKYISEASSSYIILQQIQQRLHSNAAVGHTVQPLCSHLQALAGEDGVLKQYKSDMEQVVSILLQVKNYRFRRVFVWHREKGKIEDIFRKVERHKSSIQLALSHDQLSLSGHTHEVLNKVEGRIETTATSQATENKLKIIKWLYKSTVNHDRFQRDYNASAQDGTGQAFLSSDTFRQWLEGTHATIFCPGLPGAGKTVMASIVKSHLDENTADGNRLTSVLYFNYQRHLEDHDHQTLLLAILVQFLSWSERVPDDLQTMHDERKALGRDDALSILESLIQSSECSFLIMDALDEFYDDDGARSRFLHLIKRLQASGNLRIMMTARPHLTDDAAIGKWPDATIEITASDDDLHTYLDHKICNFPYLPDDLDLRESIADRIVEASAGIFLLAVLHSDSLKDAYNEFEVEDILASLSKGPDALDRAYEDAIKRIDHQPATRRHYAHLTISWMVQCLQPLTPKELQHAVIKPEHLKRGLTASALIKIDALVSFCAGLVTFDHESNVVRFVHYTTQEYFTRDRLTKWLPGADMDPAQVCTTYLMNSELLKAVEYKNECDSDYIRKQKEWKLSGDYLLVGIRGREAWGPELASPGETQDALAKNWPFLDYCKKHWGSHCSEFQTPLQDFLLQFLTGPARIVYAELEQQCGYEQAQQQDYPYMPHIISADLREPTSISICSRWGLHQLTSALLDQGSEIRVAPMLDDSYDKRHCSKDLESLFNSAPPRPLRHVALDEPFLLACQNGHMELAVLLLARTTIREDVYYEAFRAADEKMNIDMLELIITRCPLDVIHLPEIAMCSSIDEVRIRNGLIQSKLQILTGKYRDSFQALFKRQSASVWVKHILEHGFDVHTMLGPQCRTGIELAAEAGCLESVRVLLNYPGVQVCKGGPDDALQLGLRHHRVEVFRALLSHTSSIPDPVDLVQSSAGRCFEYLANPKSSYWYSGASSVVVALMKDLLQYHDFSRLPFTRLEMTIRILVSEVFSHDQLDTQESILHLILHESSIDFRRTGIHGRTLLQTAIPHALAGGIMYSGEEKKPMFTDDKYTRIFNMFLEHPSFDFTGQYYNPISTMLKEHRHGLSMVHEQMGQGLDVILKLQMILEDPRFHPDTPDETGRTALSYASEYHLGYLIKMLLQHPLVDANSRDLSGRTPLSYAAGSEYAPKKQLDNGTREQFVLQILLANKNVRESANCPDTAGITPLMYSCRLGLEDHVRLLLDIAGSEVNLTDNRGRTPLLHALENPESTNEPLAVLLANPNIKVNAKDKDGRSTLFYVFKYQHFWSFSRPGRDGGPNISLILQHEDLDLSEDLRNMCDDNGSRLCVRDVLRFVKVLRARGPRVWPYRQWAPPSPTELRRLDYLESMFSVGNDQSDTDASQGSDAVSVGTSLCEEWSTWNIGT